MEKVSIVIPCYNDGAYIRETVTSARKQTYPSVEIIIVNDGSEDMVTREVLRQMEGEGLRVIWNEHRGVAHARNTGIRCATGKYILPLDADDLIEPEYLAEAVAVLAAKPDVGMVYCEADSFDGRTGPWVLPEFTIGMMLARNVIFNAAVFRKLHWESVGGYDETMKTALEDWDFWLAFLEKGLHPFRLPKLLFHYRIRSTEHTSYSHRDVLLQDKLEVYQTIAVKHRDLYTNHIKEYVYAMRLILEEYERLDAKKTQLQLDASDRWIRLSQQIDWERVEATFGDQCLFLRQWSQVPARFAFGYILIQEITGYSAEELVQSVRENPYMQYLCAGSFGGGELPVSTYLKIRERLTPQVFQKMLAECLREE